MGIKSVENYIRVIDWLYLPWMHGVWIRQVENLLHDRRRRLALRVAGGGENP